MCSFARASSFVACIAVAEVHLDHLEVTSWTHSASRMLRSAIEACLDELRNRETDHNPFWVLAECGYAGRLIERLLHETGVGCKWVSGGR